MAKPISIDPETQTLVDTLLMERGGYDPLDLLIEEGRLDPDDMAQWRREGKAPLADWLFGDAKQIEALLREAADYAVALGLEAEAQVFTRQGGAEADELRCATQPAFDALLRTRYRRPEKQAQMDLFMDGTSTAQLTGALQALADQRLDDAQAQLQGLRATDPGHVNLGELERLVEAANQLESPLEDTAAALNDLEDNLLPLAGKLMGTDARRYLQPLWQRLANALRGQPFDPDHPRLHISHVAERLADWRLVIEGIEAEANWWQHSLLLRRHARAKERMRQTVPALESWFQLCWRFPEQAASLGREAARQWREHWRDFEALEPPMDNSDFPAWLLIQSPGITAHLSQQSIKSAPPAFLSTAALLRDAQGDISLRKALKDIHPRLFDCYLQRVDR